MGKDTGGFGFKLRTHRRRAGLSQLDLARQSGLSVRAISDLERGRTRWPYQDSLRRLADALLLDGTARTEFIAAGGRRLADLTDPAPQTRPASRPGAGRIVPRQLPAAVPGFTGRDAQLAALSQLLDRPGGTTVITAIGGTAGVGKTALAVQWGHQVAAEFPDGQLYVDLRGFDPSGSPMSAVEAVRMFLDGLGVAADRLPAVTEAQFAMYRSLLAGQRMLVLLDNARDAAQVRPLLPGSATCRVVVTSRNQLASLTAREAAQPMTLDVMTDAESRQLLRHRLGADRLDAEPEAAKRIIERCARLPLALCVIAARAATMPDRPLAQVAADVAGRRNLDAFADDGDQAADVRAAFSWSYRQLEPAVARAFRLAGLHPGGRLDKFAVAALAGTTADDAGRMLETLASAFLLKRADPGRYSQHDLLRSYAAELAEREEGENAAARPALTRLFDYYLYAAATAMDVTFPAERHRRPPVEPPATEVPAFVTEADAYAWLDAQRANLVAMSGYAVAHGWPDHAIRLSTTIFRYLDTSAQFADALTVHGLAGRAARETGNQAAEATALHHLGSVDARQGRYESATATFGRALALHRQSGDLAGQARVLANLGITELLQGRPEQAVEHFNDSLALHAKRGDRTGMTRALGNLGFAAMRQGRYAEAAGYVRQSLELSRETGDRGGEARALANLGEIEINQDQHQQAAENLAKALTLWRQLGDRTAEADILASLGVAALRQRRYAEATASTQQALALARLTGDVARQALAHNGLGEVMTATGRTADARKHYQAALDLAGPAGEVFEQARAHEGLANAYAAQGAATQARKHWQEALTRYAELGAPQADQVRARLTPGHPRTALAQAKANR